jgi:uncharacterized protein YndB with AHSA1/START domain/GNAT superfamily N-acetyltransferase
VQQLAHSAEIEIGAPPERVWDGIVNPELTRRYVFGCDIEGDWRPGGAWRYVSAGRVAVEGTVVEVGEPERLRMTARDLWNPKAEHDPPYFITWEVHGLPGGRSRVRLTRDGYESENASYLDADDVGAILKGMRATIDPEVAASLRRLDEIGPVEVHPLTPERRDDFLDLFDNRAFADNPSWQGCYCFNFRSGGEGMPDSGDNRTDMGAAIAQGRAHGLLAYVDGRAVGWCSASPKTEMPGLLARDWMPPGTDRVGMVGCLVITSQYRRHGVARSLVAAAGDYLAGLGCTVVEAYPVRSVDSDAHGFYGPLEIYRDLGFETHVETPQRLVVRKRLA